MIEMITVLLCMILKHMALHAFVLFSYRKKTTYTRDTECRTNKTDILSLPDYHRLGKEAKIKIPVLLQCSSKGSKSQNKNMMSVKVEVFTGMQIKGVNEHETGC